MKKTVSFRATAEPFGSPDGVTKEFQLEYQGKDLIQPIDLAVTAMHQTDWQGRLALSNQPRTNYWSSSESLTGTTTNHMVTLSAGAPSPRGAASERMTASAVSGEHYIEQNLGSAPGNWTFSFFARAAGVSKIGVEAVSVGDTGTAIIIAANLATGSIAPPTGFVTATRITAFQDEWFLCEVDFTSSSAATSVRGRVEMLNASGTNVFAGDGSQTVDVFGVQMTPQLQSGVYIPTTSAPVTVTDYTVDTSGNVTFGQAPAKKASLDWDGSATADFVDASDTFLAQYATSPILTSLIQAANAAIDPRADFDAFMANVWDVYTAQGFGLDIWGRIVNIPRTINIPASNDYFGFDEALPDAEPFNQAPFYSGPQAGTLYTLSDAAYRVLILTKALANISSFTAQSMNALLNFMFNGQGTTRGSCYVLENATPMQITYVFNFALQSWEAAVLQQASLMPRPAGVGLTITVNP